MRKTLVVIVVLCALFAAATASAKNFECRTIGLTGVIDGNVVVPEGAFCLTSAATITGSVRVEPGALGFHSHNSTILGNVLSPGDIVFDIRILDSHVGGNVDISKTHAGTFGAICRSTIDGDLHWNDNGGFETIGIGFPANVCTAGNTIHGNVVLSNNSGELGNFTFNNNQVDGNVIVNNNVGFENIHDNNIGGVLQCESNSPPPVNFANTPRSFHGQCGQ